MSQQRRNPTVADDAARARKLLAKHEPLKVNGLNKANFTLQQGLNQRIGEHAVIAVIGPRTVHQYTISRPIGVTEWDKEVDWVINSTEYLPSMMARLADPAQSAINQARSQLRTKLAVDYGFLKEVRHVDGSTQFFYPHREDMSRNQLLDDARHRIKEEQSALRRYIEEATDPTVKARYRAELGQMWDPVKYLDETTRLAEQTLRGFWSDPDVEHVLIEEVPQTFQTLTGPFADQVQSVIYGAKGRSLDEVVNAVSASISKISIQPKKNGEEVQLSETLRVETPADQPLSEEKGAAAATAPKTTGGVVARVAAKFTLRKKSESTSSASSAKLSTKPSGEVGTASSPGSSGDSGKFTMSAEKVIA